jgi:hypothetical protein
VVPRPHADTVLVENLSNVVRVNAVEVEADDPRTLI